MPFYVNAQRGANSTLDTHDSVNLIFELKR